MAIERDGMVEYQPQKTANSDRLSKRIGVVVVLLPIGLAANYLGGWFFSVLMAIVLGIAVYEYVLMFQAGGLQPAMFITVGATAVIVASRAVLGVEAQASLFSLIILLALTFHLFEFERGREKAGTDFAVTISGIAYLGWLGSYLVALRTLPDGMWWVLVVLPAIWLTDTAAYMVGVRIGKHKMTARLSPKKSWEGYLAGIIVAIPGTMLLTLLWIALGAGPNITPVRAGLLAAVLATVTILGDLGESMMKRQVGMKDSSHLLPGHGGVFDRIDSWVWGGVIGYIMITMLFV